MLPTSDQEAFARNVHEAKKAAFKKMVEGDKVPLRAGVQQVGQRGAGGRGHGAARHTVLRCGGARAGM